MINYKVRRMEKKYLLFALCSFMTMSFVSCDNDDDPKPEVPTESSTTGVYFLNAGKLGSYLWFQNVYCGQ